MIVSTEPILPSAGPVLAADPSPTPGTALPSAAESGPEMLVSGASVQGAPALADFTEDTLFAGQLYYPTAVAFAPNGHVFVAEKAGTVKEFDSLTDTSATIRVDLRPEVHNYWDRGLLGLALDPNFPATPKIYVAYTHDAPIGGTAPTWGVTTPTSDPCPTPPGPTANGCVVSSRVSAVTLGSGGSFSEQVLVEDWCQQYPSHSISDVVVGPDGYLYVGGGDGANFNYADYGQQNAGATPDPDYPNNPCGDPPGGVGGTMELPSAEGGSLRSQDYRTTSDPQGLDGSVIRVSRTTGAGVSGNPLFGSADANARRIIASGFRNPFRLTFRPGTNELWVGDVGQSTWEEVDRITDTTPASVLNYGWPCREGNATGPTPLPTATICTGVTGVPPAWTYQHGQPAASTDCDLTGSSASVSGLAFVGSGGSFPPSFDGTLFVSDYSRQCIWALPKGSNDLPDPSAAYKFADASHPVQLKTGPDGSLYYVDFEGTGSVRRIRYDAPVARIQASTTSGPAPLFVQFDGTGSTTSHPPLSYEWDLDGDGQYDDSTSPTPSITYTTGGLVTVRLRVTDSASPAKQDTEQVVVDVGQNDLPVPVIATPSASLTWAVGDTVSFSGSATDTEDGTLPATSLDWALIMQHCPSDCHEHVVQTWEGVASGSFVAPDHEYPSHLTLRLTATDSVGRSATVSRDLQPKTSTVTLESDPAGLQLSFAGHAGVTPFDVTVIRGSTSSLVAPTPEIMGGVTYVFDAWMQGGPASQDVVASSPDLSFRAIYEVSSVDVARPTVAPPSQKLISAGVTSGKFPVRVSWDAASDPAPSSGILRYKLQVRRKLHGTWGAWATVSLTGSQTQTLKLPQGVHQFRLRAQDRAGNWSAWKHGAQFRLTAAQAEPAITFGGTWRTQTNASFFKGSSRFTGVQGRSAEYTFSGRQVAWLTSRGPNRGAATVFIDGVAVTTIDLYATSTKYRRVLFLKHWGSSGTHTIRIEVTTPGGASSGSRVDVDAFLTLK